MDPVISLLLIEDDEDDYALLVDTLAEITSPTYAITWAQTYEEGRQQLLGGAFDVCFLDHRLGARTGLELLAEVRGFANKPPIVFLTAQTEREIDLEAMKAGAADFLNKHHITPAQLERTIRYAIDRSAAVHTLQRLNLELQRARNQALQSSAAKSAFLASVSHELRTPLNAILGYSELILEILDEPEPLEEPATLETIRNDLRRVHDAGSHLLALVSDVLDLSRIESGHLSIIPREIDVISLVDQTLASLQSLASINGNTLALTAPPELGSIQVDPTRLRQIVVNIVGNACKFTQSGRITVDVTPGEGSPPALEIAIRDTGIGISPEQLGRLFASFSQADETISRRFGGTGLGLAISRRLARLMGGEIRVASTYGVGSTFTLSLPRDVRPFIRATTGTGATEETTAETTAGATSTDSTIVIFGHNPGLLRELREHLGAPSIRASAAIDPAAALALVAEFSPTQILVEIDIGSLATLPLLAALAGAADREFTLTVFLLAPSGLFGLPIAADAVVGRPLGEAQVAMALALRADDPPSPVRLFSNNSGLRAEASRLLGTMGCDLTRGSEERSTPLFLLDLTAPGFFSSYAFAQDRRGHLHGLDGLVVLVVPETPPRPGIDIDIELRPLLEHYGLPRTQLVEALARARHRRVPYTRGG